MQVFPYGQVLNGMVLTIMSRLMRKSCLHERSSRLAKVFVKLMLLIFFCARIKQGKRCRRVVMCDCIVSDWRGQQR